MEEEYPGKRQLPHLEEIYPTQKKIKIASIDRSQLLLYRSLCSPFIVPSIAVNISNPANQFRHRLYKLVQCNLKVHFPTFSILDTKTQLEKLKQKYPSKIKKDNKNEDNTKKYTKKEGRLLKAAQLLSGSEMTQKEIALSTSLSINDIKSLRVRMRKTGSILPKKCKKKFRLRLCHIAFIDALLSHEQNVVLTLEDIRKRLVAIYPELYNVQKSVISRTMHKHGFVFKKISNRPERRNYSDVRHKRKLVSQKIVYCLDQEYEIIFVDETSVHLHETRRYGWGRKGKKLSIRSQPKSSNYSVISAVTPKNFLGCQIVKGGAKKEDFLGFLCTLIRHYEFKAKSTELIIFLDNASIHHSDLVTYYMGNQVTLLYNAPYSPMLNPIEEFFSKFKIMLRKLPAANELELIKHINNVIRVFPTRDFKGYVSHMLKFIEISLYDGSLI